jgi:hypothetical protein
MFISERNYSTSFGETMRLYGFHSLFLALVFGLGCKGQEGPAGPSGSAGPKLKGDLAGFVLIVNENGGQPSDKSGVTVTVEGTSFQTSTDASGAFVISNIETGTYTIAYSKAGYGTSKTVGYQFAGGGRAFLGTIAICQPPTYSVQSLVASSATSLRATLSSASATTRAVAVFVGTSAGVSASQLNYSTVGLFSGTPTNGVMTLTPSFMMYRGAGFESGTTAYLIAYAITEGGRTSGHTDVNTGKFVYTNLSSAASNVVSVTVP